MAPQPKPVAVDEALAMALAEAAKGRRWDVVAQLARELEARRLAERWGPSRRPLGHGAAKRS